MEKVTPEMREKLRVPLSSEAVSPHPTKSYLSSIKSIYVAERINDVFGIGSWTLTSHFVERVDKFVVVLAMLAIPEYGFYGEAYGGNDNSDLGDAYKGAVTDGFTKIAAQQLEIGIDVFKGIHEVTKQKIEAQEHWCEEHQTKFFMKGKMKSYAHPVKDANGNDTGEWCHEHKEQPASIKEPEPEPTVKIPEQVEKLAEELWPPDPEPQYDFNPEWLLDSLKQLNWKEDTIKSYLKNVYKVDTEGTVVDVVARLTREQRELFFAEIQNRLDKLPKV